MKDKSFTIRLPEELVDQIDMRCGINFRSRNREIQALLTFAIDALTSDHKDAMGSSKSEETT